MNTLFISDLHLEDRRPLATAILSNFLRGPAKQADALYILGDLFELWIGDDVLSETAQLVADGLSALGNEGIPCYFLHGNRDFLLGPDYAAQAGLELLPEAAVVDLYGTPTVILHGDTLCTDDLEYQAFRRKVRNKQFQDMFLNMSPEQRLEIAQNARDASKQHTGNASMSIMDVNQEAVLRSFVHHRVECMIHGHTHRPASHLHDLGKGVTGKRLVLADWYSHGSYLRVGQDGHELVILDN